MDKGPKESKEKPTEKNDKNHEQIQLIIYILTYNPLDIWKKNSHSLTNKQNRSFSFIFENVNFGDQ